MTQTQLNKAYELNKELLEIEKMERQAPEETTLNLLTIMNRYEPGYSRDLHAKLLTRVQNRLAKRKKELHQEMLNL